MGEGSVKNPEKMPTLFMDGPCANKQLRKKLAAKVRHFFERYIMEC